MNDGALFVEPGYLQPLERFGCISPVLGWTPLAMPALAAPVYLKTHSWGEFVFDFQFARAYAEHGLHYYPKLVCAVPYTPVPGPRIGAGSGEALLQQARARDCSSAHVLFLPETEAAALQEQGWLRRVQPRYLWRNPGYKHFDDFLAALDSKRRKNIRRERNMLQAAGVSSVWKAGQDLSEDEWVHVFRMYENTYLVRGQEAYLNLPCLRAWATHFRERMQFCLGYQQDQLVAMAFFFHHGKTLYGRHWGTLTEQKGLHFELCYYQGIEYCIRHELAVFDAGVQGEHKLLRGFEARFSLSMHYFLDARFQSAIARFCRQETAA